MTPATRSMRDLVLDGLLSGAPLAVFAYDETGTCVFSEGAVLDQLGLRPGDLVGEDLFARHGSDPDLVDRMRRALGGDTIRRTDTVGEHTYDTWYLPLARDVSERAMAVGISVDVTDRAAFEAAQRLYRAFADAAPQFIALAGVDGSVHYVNPGGRRLAGIPDDVDVTTTTIADFLTPEGLEASLRVERPAVIRDGSYRGETTLRYWPTGEGIPVEVSSFLVTDPGTGAPMALATVQSDLRPLLAGREAVQRQVEYQRGLLHHLHQAQEAERQRIAADIHDDTVQVMAAVNMRLQALRRALEGRLPPERAAELEAVDLTVREATSRLRRQLVELDQPDVGEGDVGAGLRAVVGAALTRDLVTSDVDLDVDVATEPSAVIARVAVRIAHEALTNVRKHAQATHVAVRLRQVAGEYVLQVVDNGVGLAPERPSGTRRGVRGMTERAESVGGTLTLGRRADGGVVVEARLPHVLGHPEQGGAFPGSWLYLEQVMEMISDGYLAVDEDWRFVFANRAAYALLRHDPADGLVGRRLWEVLDAPPELAAACHRARDARAEVEVTTYHQPWDAWIHHRLLPTAGGLSIFARDVTADVVAAGDVEAHQRLVVTGSELSFVMAAGGKDDTDVLYRSAAKVAETWPLRGIRITWPGGEVTAGTMSGPVRRVPLLVEAPDATTAVEVGSVDLVGEEVPLDPHVLQLLAVRVSAAVSGT